MTKEVRERLHRIAGRIQLAGLVLSALFGGFVGLIFAKGMPMAWSFAFGGFLSLLWVGMIVVVISAISQRIPAGAWREGLRLSCQIFLVQTTVYALTILVLALVPLAAIQISVPSLALSILPGLYLSSVLVILISCPLYLAWLPVRHE